jgi:hypothetical protein
MLLRERLRRADGTRRLEGTDACRRPGGLSATLDQNNWRTRTVPVCETKPDAACNS